MTLGVFAFDLPTLAYHELQRTEAWRHAQGARIGARAASQYLGPGEDKVTLEGIVAPELTGQPASLGQLRDMATAGDAYDLVTGAGDVLGAYVIEGLNTTQTAFRADGTPRKITFSLALLRVDDDDSALSFGQ